jgi:hypothetical protein
MEDEIDKVDAQRRFEAWLADHHEALARFFLVLPAPLVAALDYSPASLDALEGWLLLRYPSSADARPAAEAPILDGAARYLGETFVQQGNGTWSLGDTVGDVFFGLPVVTGLPAKDPACPPFLARAALNKRTGRVWTTALRSYLQP